MIPVMPKDTKTRYQGVYARHKQGCALEAGGSRCSCKPSYYGVAYDRARHKTVRTRRQLTVDAARSARAELLATIERGEPTAIRGVKLTDARKQFVKAAREGRALNKRGRRYKPKAIDDIEISLKTHVEPKLGGRRINELRRGEIQARIDEMTATHSGSRIRSVVNSLRALYTWAQYRDLAGHDPAQHVHLPAMNPTPIDRVASPGEFARLLDALKLADAVPYALAGYGMARAEQIRRVHWEDVDLELGLIEWGVEWEAAKYEASHRTVPTVPPLLSLLKRHYLEQGRPAGDALVCPPVYRSASGFMSTNGLAKRARKRWVEAKLEPITLQEARHTAATWIDAAGVSPRVASVLIGHAVPALQAGAAPVTLRTYTHALPEDIERARDQLASYLSESVKREAVR